MTQHQFKSSLPINVYKDLKTQAYLKGRENNQSSILPFENISLFHDLLSVWNLYVCTLRAHLTLRKTCIGCMVSAGSPYTSKSENQIWLYTCCDANSSSCNYLSAFSLVFVNNFLYQLSVVIFLLIFFIIMSVEVTVTERANHIENNCTHE